MKSEELALKPLPPQTKWVIFFKVLAIFGFIWTLIVITTETTLIWNIDYTIVNWWVKTNENNTAANFIFSVFFLSGMTLNCLFTIFNLKMSDYVQLKP
jgi:hypothetical protein